MRREGASAVQTAHRRRHTVLGHSRRSRGAGSSGASLAKYPWALLGCRAYPLVLSTDGFLNTLVPQSLYSRTLKASQNESSLEASIREISPRSGKIDDALTWMSHVIAIVAPISASYSFASRRGYRRRVRNFFGGSRVTIVLPMCLLEGRRVVAEPDFAAASLLESFLRDTHSEVSFDYVIRTALWTCTRKAVL